MDWINAVFNGVEVFVVQHPFFTLMIVGAYITAVSQLPAPTSSSSIVYREIFAVLNFFALQFRRMYPKVESSPNFEKAVNLQQTLAGQTPTPVQVPPEVEDKK